MLYRDSNLAGDYADIAISAPGCLINSTVVYNKETSKNQKIIWDVDNGTSMSAPYVTGSIALVAQAYPYLSAKQLVDTILSTANKDYSVEPYYFQYANLATKESPEPSFSLIFTYDYTKNDLNDTIEKIYEERKEEIKLLKVNSLDEFKEKVKIYKYTKEQIFGQGFLDVGKAVQGPGYYDANRIGDEYKKRQGDKELYYYVVDTGKPEDNYQKRKYSIWSNDIGEKRKDDNLSVGLLKSGKVDLILLGDNTYTGETVAYDGNVQIVKGVSGDVSARTNGIITLNGKAKNVYAIDGGKVYISDKIDKSKMDATLNSFLPDSNVVLINGALVASGDNSLVSVDLSKPESTITGPAIQVANGVLDISLANGSKFSLLNESQRYDGNSLTTNDTIDKLTLSNNGTLDTTEDANKHDVTINTLTGNNGIFKLKTNLLQNTGDKVTINNAEGEQNHKIIIVNRNGYNSPDDVHSVLIAEAPNSINFTGLSQDIVNGKEYTPAIDFLEDGDRHNWYFYGYNEQLANDEPIIINIPVTASGIYTTNHIFNDGIVAYNATFKVNKTNLPRLQVNKTSGNYPRAGILGSTRFIGDGPIDVNIKNDTRIYTINTIGIGLDNDKDDYDFSSEQTVNINIKNEGGLVTGINNNKIHNEINKTTTNHMSFLDDLNINYLNEANNDLSFYGRNDGGIWCIDNNGEISVAKDLNIDIKSIYDENIHAIENEGTISVAGNMNLTTSSRGSLGLLINKGNIDINGKTIIKSEDDKYVDWKLGESFLLKSTEGVINFKDDVYFDMKSNGAKYSYLTGVSIGKEQESEKDDYNANVNVMGDLNIKFDNIYVSRALVPLKISSNGNLNVDGTLSISVPTPNRTDGSSSDNILVAGTLKSNNFITNSKITNSGSMNIKNNFDAYEYNGNRNSKLTVQGISRIDKFSNLGDINCNELYVKDWLKDSYGTTSIINKLIIDNKISELDSNYSIKNLEITNDVYDEDLNYDRLEFNNESNINKDGSGTVKINRNISLRAGIIRFSNEDSYLNGTFYGREDANLIIENGARWIVNDKYPSFNHHANYGNTMLNNGGKIIIPINQHIILSTLSGNNGIFEFDIKQNHKNSGNIIAGTVTIEKNITEGATHTIKLTPVQADFILTNDVTVKPFDVIWDASVRNGGKKLNFKISHFDAGVYNYTPKLINNKLGETDVWTIADIKVTGSDSESSENVNSIDTPNYENNESGSNTEVSPGSSVVDVNESGTNTGSNTPPAPNAGTNIDSGSNASGKADSNTTEQGSSTGENSETNNNGSEQTTNTNSTEESNDDNKSDATNDKSDANNNSDTSTTDNNANNHLKKLVLSNLTHNVEAASINNYHRWRNEYNNLTKRLGDLRSANEDDGIWFRTFNGKQESNTYGMNSNYTGMQLGYDKMIPTSHEGKFFIGGAITHYQGSSSFKHQGQSKNRSNGLAVYGSWLGNKGHYADIILRHSRMKTDLTSYADGTGDRVTGNYHDWGTSLSIEYGRKIDLPHNYYIQPEAELIYGHIGSSDYELSEGTRVHQNSINSWTARAGIKIGRQVKDNNFYASINYLHDFGGNSSYSIADKYGAAYSSSCDLNDSWWEVNIGGNFKINDNTYCYAELEKTFGGNVNTKLQGNIGIRWSF